MQTYSTRLYIILLYSSAAGGALLFTESYHRDNGTKLFIIFFIDPIVTKFSFRRLLKTRLIPTGIRIYYYSTCR